MEGVREDTRVAAEDSRTSPVSQDPVAANGHIETASSSSFRIDVDEESRPSVSSTSVGRAAESAEDAPQPLPSPPPQSTQSGPVNQPLQQQQQPQQQQSGDLATANRLLRTCRTLIDQLNKQLASEKEENAKIREEFQKYKVRTELARKNSELEITNLSEVNLKFKQYNVVSHDVQAELDALRRRFEHVEKERIDAVEELARVNRLLTHEKIARKRAEDDLQESIRRSENIGPEALEQAKQLLSEELNELKREFRLYRESVGKMLEDKDAEIVRARTSSEASTELAYLRDVIIKYLASVNDPAARNSMEAAIASVLRFNQAEVDYVKEKRRHDMGWKVALSSLGIT